MSIEMVIDMEIRINITENIISIKDENSFDQWKHLLETKGLIINQKKCIQWEKPLGMLWRND